MTQKDKMQIVSLIADDGAIIVKVGNVKHIKAITGEPLFACVDTIARDGEHIKGVEIDYYQNPKAIHVYDLDTFGRGLDVVGVVECMQELAKSDLNDYAILGINWQELPR